MANVKNCFLSLGAFILFIGLVLGSKGIDVPLYAQPLTFIVIFLILSPITIWVMSAFLGALYVISLDLTSKEKAVMEREVIDPSKRKHMYHANLNEKIANLKNFFLREMRESHIIS